MASLGLSKEFYCKHLCCAEVGFTNYLWIWKFVFWGFFFRGIRFCNWFDILCCAGRVLKESARKFRPRWSSSSPRCRRNSSLSSVSLFKILTTFLMGCYYHIFDLLTSIKWFMRSLSFVLFFLIRLSVTREDVPAHERRRWAPSWIIKSRYHQLFD